MCDFLIKISEMYGFFLNVCNMLLHGIALHSALDQSILKIQKQGGRQVSGLSFEPPLKAIR